MRISRFSRKVLDVGVMSGFLGLLCLITAIGLIGIKQITSLNRVAQSLARADLPLQNAVFEMRINNARFSASIRHYLSWRHTRFLDAAGIVQRQGFISSASENFNRYLQLYLDSVLTEQEKQWGRTVGASQQQLVTLGTSIVELVDKLDKMPQAEKQSAQAALERMQREFESKVFWIDAFLDNPMQRDILQKLDRKLSEAGAGQRKAVVFLWVSLAVAIFLGFWTAYLTYRRMKQDQLHREELWRRFVTAQEEERNNLSLQIHDEMGQDLSGLKIYLGLLEKEAVALPQDSKDKIDKSKTILDDLMKKTHNISEILRPPEIDEVGLFRSIAGLVLQNKEVTGARYSYHLPQEELDIPPEEKLVLYRVVQEALTNIAKYSKANSVDIFLREKGAGILLIISDDGVGFDMFEEQNRPMRRKEDKVKLGLKGLRERIELLDGTLSIASGRGKGTRLEVWLPVRRAAKKETPGMKIGVK